MSITKVKYSRFKHEIASGTIFGIEHFVFAISLNDGAKMFEKLASMGIELIEEKIHAFDEIMEYLDGERKIFSVLPKVLWGTPFQRRVWCETKNIPYGSRITYSELAKRCGNPSAVRAVGMALAANPIPIIIPCHRVLRSDEKLGGFSAGIEVKKRLLELEKKTAIFIPIKRL